MRREDLAFVNRVRNLDETRHFLRDTRVITMSETLQWFEEYRPLWLIVYADDDKVAYVRLSHDTGETICIGCDVKPEMRRMGIASSVYKTLISEFYESGYRLVWLEVFDDNTNAITLYKKLGFKQTNQYLWGDRKAYIMVHSNER